MSNKKWFYTKNNNGSTDLLDHEVNKTFEEILWMNDSEFALWLRELRSVVIQIWDEKGIPPRVGCTEREIIEQFNSLDDPKLFENFIVKDELTGECDVIRNTATRINAVNQWFPTMMKTKISYTQNGGLSIYDHFKNEELFEKTLTYARRNFKRDSFYHYSSVVRWLPKDCSVKNIGHNLFPAQTGKDWILRFEREYRIRNEFDYWLESKDNETIEYSGYNEELKNAKCLFLTPEDLIELNNLIPNNCKTNIDLRRGNLCYIRVFKYNQKLFPMGLKAFRITWCQQAVNFPAITAKFLYEKYTENIKDKEVINIWDPSAGWGGRLIGALSVRQDRNIHYIGTDPNTDHNTENGRTKYHELADFYNTKTYRGNSFFQQKPINTYEILQCGSEEVSERSEFQKYKGKIDIVFTSPPYFCKEIYSSDNNQSCNKFKTYEDWKHGYLIPTLKTAVEWLSPQRYLLWNISDITLGKDILPLENDSCEILKDLGMVYIHTIKMSLAQMPGGNRVDHDTGKSYSRNVCKVLDTKNKKKQIYLKYEPIFVWYKP